MPLQLTSRLEEWEDLSTRELQALHAAGMDTVYDVLLHLPRRHEDRRQSIPITSLTSGDAVSLQVHVYSCGWRFSYKRYFEVSVGAEGEPYGARLLLRWFNMPYVAKMLATGMNLSIYGKVREYGGKMTMANPEFEVMEDEDAGYRLAAASLGGVCPPSVSASQDCIHTARLVPVYRNVGGLALRSFRALVWRLLHELPEDARPLIHDVAPSYPYARALMDLHFPETQEDARKARLRFALEECFAQQFRVAWKRRCSAGLPGQITATTDAYMKEMLAALPFPLTKAQQRCIGEIRRDMASPRQMNRLLQGDVGSGKTLVALCAMLLAVESGRTAALMAPTQILAEQHFNNFRHLLRHTDVRLSLRTGERSDDTSATLLETEIDASPRLIIGTHALLYKKNRPINLGLVVIDEQHKFGVAQREKLILSGDRPDILVMTATPIPRTLTLTLYGELDVSLIDELPHGRGKIITVLRTERSLPSIVRFMKEELAAGKQIYIVSPLVEDNGKSERSSATSELVRWQKLLPGEPIGLLHGRLSAEEKDAAMAAFRANETHILVTTTVVEVGVDVSNATVMLIHNADSFGLSQLHQLRGRIGRGHYKSYCILLSQARPGEPGREKLDVLCRTLNGFEIAEEDFRLRGPGDVLGTAQSGLGTVQFPEWLADTRLIHRANREAHSILEQDPELESPNHASLRQLIDQERQERIIS